MKSLSYLSVLAFAVAGTSAFASAPRYSACANTAVSGALNALYPGCENEGTCPNVRISVKTLTSNRFYQVTVGERVVQVETKLIPIDSGHSLCRATKVRF